MTIAISPRRPQAYVSDHRSDGRVWEVVDSERVSAGLRKLKLKGETLGRPPLTLDHGRIGRLRASGIPIREISAQLGVSASTVHRTLQQCT